MRIKILLGCVAIGLLVVGVTVAVRARTAEKNNAPAQDQKMEQQLTLPFETARADELNKLSDAQSSWPGELVSPTTIEVHPESEGAITQLSVRVGQRVSRGDIIARLSPQPASIERADAASKKKEMLIRARANLKATERVVAKSSAQLLEAKKSLVPARNAATDLARKDAQRNRYVNDNTPLQREKLKAERQAAVDLATRERDHAILDISLKEKTLRTILEQSIDRNLQELTTAGNQTVASLSKNWTFQFKQSVGQWESNSREAFQQSLAAAIKDLKKESSVSLDDSALRYAQSLKNLVSATVLSDDITQKDIDAWKKMAREDQMEIVDAVNDRQESESMARVKEKELAKMIADQEKELTDSSITVTQSAIDSESNDIAKKKADIDSELEYQNRSREIEVRLIELNRDLELARAEVAATETAYETFISALSSQNIVAQQSGTISSILKNTGDYVSPETVVAFISQLETADAFIRFRIPNDTALPALGDEVSVVRPSFPFDKRTAIIIGVGNTVGENGAFTAEAEFTKSTDWPIHALVRVMPTERASRIRVPFTALRLDDENQSHIYVAVSDQTVADRIVKTGKAIGDTVEILEGLSPNERYLARPIPHSTLKKILVTDTGGEQDQSEDGSSEEHEQNSEDEESDSMDVMGHE